MLSCIVVNTVRVTGDPQQIWKYYRKRKTMSTAKNCLDILERLSEGVRLDIPPKDQQKAFEQLKREAKQLSKLEKTKELNKGKRRGRVDIEVRLQAHKDWIDGKITKEEACERTYLGSIDSLTSWICTYRKKLNS